MGNSTDASRSQEAAGAKPSSIEEMGDSSIRYVLDVVQRINDSRGSEAADTALRIMRAHADDEITYDEAMTLGRAFGAGDWQDIRDRLDELGVGHWRRK